MAYPSSRVRLWLFLGLTPLIPSATLGQQVFDRTPTCPDCRIELQPVVTLGYTDGDGAMPTIAAAVKVDSAGRYVVLLIDGSPPYLFGPDGSFVGRVGREGEGPGEFQMASALEVTGGRIRLYDQGTGRLTEFDQELELLSTSQMPGMQVSQTLWLGEQRQVVNMLGMDSASIGYAVHFLGADMQAYALRDRHPVVAGDGGYMRHLAIDDAGQIWSTNRFGAPRIRQYTPDGTLVAEWVADAEGEPPSFTYGDPENGVPPSQQVFGAWVADGLVWVLSVVPDERWKTGLRKVEGRVRIFYTLDDSVLAYDGLLEVFDPAQGTVLASRRVDGVDAELVLGAGLLGQLRRDDLGWSFVDVRRVRLINPQP